MSPVRAALFVAGERGPNVGRMRRRLRTALVSIGVTAGTVIASVAAGSPASAAAPTTYGSWNLDEAPGASTARDASGHGNDGTVGSDIQTGVRVSGATGYRFPTWASTAARHEVIVPESDELDPGAGDFAVSVRFRTARYYSNVVQKGQSGTSGGYWKVEVAQGRITCHFTNSTGRTVAVKSAARYDNGAWHSVRCGRAGGTVSLYVDGVKRGSRTGLTGSVGNGAVLAIGGKAYCDGETIGCDFFAGDIDYVRVQKG